MEHYTSPFEVKKVETLVANFGHKAKHQTIDKLPDMLPAFLVLGFTMWYVMADQVLPFERTYKKRRNDVLMPKM